MVKQLRTQLDQAGFRAVPILATESSGATNINGFLGTATPQGFGLLKADPVLASTIGGKSYPAQDLVFGDPQRAELTKLGRVLRRVWTTVRPGWRVLSMHSSDPGFRTDNEAIVGGFEPNGNMMSRGTDMITFANPDNSRQLLLLVNRHSAPRTVARLDGLAGAGAQVFLTTGDGDLESQPERSITENRLAGGPLVLPPLSVVLIITDR